MKKKIMFLDKITISEDIQKYIFLISIVCTIELKIQENSIVDDFFQTHVSKIIFGFFLF